MNYQRPVLLAFLLAVSAIVFAQDLVTQYVEGIVELERTGLWQEIGIGDSVPSDATLRLGPYGLLELQGPSGTVLLSRPGIYQVEALLGAAAATADAGVAGLLRGRVRRLVQDDGPRDAVAAGVRASEAPDREDIIWAGDESVSEMITRGITLLATEEYEEAYLLFSDAWAFADTPEIPQAQFYLGYSAYLLGRMGEAVSFLAEPAPDPATSWYDDHLLTLAHLQVASMAWDEASSLLTGYVAGLEEPGKQERSIRETTNFQNALLLQALALQGSGDIPGARARLERLRTLDPASETAEVADSILKSM